MFGLFKKKEPPILKPGMLAPVDTPISTAQAKKVYKEWMGRIGHFTYQGKPDKEELSCQVGYFADAMKEREEEFKIDFDSEKEQTDELIADEKETLKDCRLDLKKCKDEGEKASLKTDIEACEEEIARLKDEFNYRAKPLENFKKDKREFLVSYINEQVHGRDWRSKL